MKKYCFLTVCIFLNIVVNSQVLVSDPALAAITLSNGLLENESYNKIKEQQNAIQALQASTVSVVTFINDWHKKLYNGLINISSVVSDAYQVKECLEVLYDIYQLEMEMLEEARPNPLALGFAVKFQKEMVAKAIQYYNEVHSFALKQGDDRLLMNAGERAILLNQILTDLRTIKAYAATSYYRVKWAVKNGIINTLNPFAGFINRDAQIVKDILSKWQY